MSCNYMAFLISYYEEMLKLSERKPDLYKEIVRMWEEIKWK